MPSGCIGSYEYYTLEDLQNIINSCREDYEEPWYQVKMRMLDMASLIQKYAMILHDYEYRYIDDGR